MAKSMEGQTTGAIANEVGLSRSQVSRILNSEEVAQKIAEINSRLAEGITDAIETVLAAVKTDYAAARDLLRNYGSMTAHIRLDHSGQMTLEQLVSGDSPDDKSKVGQKKPER